VEQVIICSPDKDLSQCIVQSRVICRDRRKGVDLASDLGGQVPAHARSMMAFQRRLLTEMPSSRRTPSSFVIRKHGKRPEKRRAKTDPFYLGCSQIAQELYKGLVNKTRSERSPVAVHLIGQERVR
jgi:hypothetical protein